MDNQEIDYNIVKMPLDAELKNEEISSGRNYLILLDAPASAVVTVRLNGTTKDSIPLSKNFAIESRNIKTIHVSCNAVEGESLIFGQSNNAEDFKIITAPVVSQIEEVGKISAFDDALLLALSKIINPFDFVSNTLGESSSTSLTTIFNSVLDCDKISLDLTQGAKDYPNDSQYCGIVAILDGILISSSNYREAQGSLYNGNIEIEGVRGSTLIIKAQSTATKYSCGFLLKKYDLKA